jgi:hypothetical protein
MTIINGIEIDNIRYIKNPIKEAILNNDPLEENLHVIMVISNPCQFASRYILAKEFIYRMNRENNVILYVVELVYGDQQYHVTVPSNPKHLQLKATHPLWHKENMINMGVRLLPANWKAFAWIDADIEFESPTFALDALKILNGCSDVIQLFSHCLDMDKQEGTMNTWAGFGYNHCKNKKYGKGKDLWHPGYAWAITRKAYQKMGGLYDLSILGSGDHNMALSFIGHGLKSVNDKVHDEYKKSIALFQNKVSHLRLGYVPGIIRHYYHGSKLDRKYSERWTLLVNHNYNPESHVKSCGGVIVPTDTFPPKLLEDILTYFKERNEDC